MSAFCFVKFKLSVLFLLCLFLEVDIYLKFHRVLHLYLICFVQFVFISRRKNNNVLCCQWFPLPPTQTIFTSFVEKTENQKNPNPSQRNKTNNKKNQVTLDWEYVSLLASWWLLCPLIVLADVSLDFIFSLIFPSVSLLMA